MPNDQLTSPQALSGIRVIELSRILAAPYCGQVLADMGAEVIKIEMPGTGDDARTFGPPWINDVSVYFLSLNRNKDSVTLNLRDERAKEALRRLIASADVFLHNSIPASIERLGFGYDEVQKINPRIVYCAISGFGLVGPDRDRPALDLAAQALSGLMSVTGEDTPYRSGAPVSDIATGVFAAFGIVTALYQREHTGKGQLVDTSLIEASVALLPYQAAGYFATNRLPARSGNAHPSIAPYNSYQTSDGWVIIATINDQLWERTCRALTLEHLIGDARFATNPDRAINRSDLELIIQERMRALTTTDALRLLGEAGVPTSQVRTIDEVFDDPQVRALGLRQSYDHSDAGPVEFVPQPVHLADSPASVRKPPPGLGANTDDRLREIGFSDEEIALMRGDGAI